MSYTIKGNLTATNMLVNNKYVGRTIDIEDLNSEPIKYSADADGELTLPVLTKEEVNKIFRLMPYSSFGNNNMLPVGMSGDFSGTITTTYRNKLINIEDDGTLVILRSGSNGSTNRLYYNFLLNAVENNGVPIPTNKIYEPDFLQGYYAYSIYCRTDCSVIIGNCINKSNGNGKTFIALTYNTLIDTFHQGIILDSSTELSGCRYAFAHGKYIYFTKVTTEKNFQVQIMRMEIDDIIYNRVPRFEYIRNWESNSFYGIVNDEDGIYLTSTLISSDINEKPLLWLASSGTTGYPYMSDGADFVAAINPDNPDEMRIVIHGDSYVSNSSLNSAGRAQHAFSLIANLKTHKAHIEAPYINYNGKAPLVCLLRYDGKSIYLDGASPLYTYVNGIYNTNTSNDNYSKGWDLNSNIAYRILQGPTLGETVSIVKLKINDENIKSLFDKIKPGLMTSYIYYPSKKITTSLGSAVGTRITQPTYLSNNSIMITSLDASQNIMNTVVHFNPVINFEYDSLSGKKYNGYAPTIERDKLKDRFDLISTHVKDGKVTACGGVFASNRNTSRPKVIDENGIVNGRIELDVAMAKQFENDTMKNILYPPEGYKNLYSSYYIHTGLEKYAFCMTVCINIKDDILQFGIHKINVTVNNDIIESITLDKAKLYEWQSIKPDSYGGIYQETGFNTQHVQYYETENEIFVFYESPLTFRALGSGGYGMMGSFYIIKSTGEFRFIDTPCYSRSVRTASTNYSSQTKYIVTPNGFGFIDYSLSTIDVSCKIYIREVGNTLNDYLTKKREDTVPIVLVSQQVAQGFILYITEETNAFMSGKLYKLPMTTMNLYDITPSPANKTFYMYVKLVKGVAEYKLSLTEIAESKTNMFIGTITTNETQIKDINVDKVNRLDIFRPSSDCVGSSFPVTTGHPHNENHLSDNCTI